MNTNSDEIEIGPHLLGRIPSPPDERDIDARYLLGSTDPFQAALNSLRASKASPATKAWATIATAHVKKIEKAINPVPPPPPTPTPEPTPVPAPTPDPTQDVIWGDPDQLNQGNTGHCGGFGWAQWGNAAPVNDHFTDADGHAIYYECKVIDGDPLGEGGTSVRSGAKAMQNRGRLAVYAFAYDLDTVRQWLRSNGPVVLGTSWYDAMFTPDPSGFVAPTGTVVGGHEYVAVGDLPGQNAILCQNSWSASWGQNGYFKLRWADLTTLLGAGGEACMALEL